MQLRLCLLLIMLDLINHLGVISIILFDILQNKIYLKKNRLDSSGVYRVL